MTRSTVAAASANSIDVTLNSPATEVVKIGAISLPPIAAPNAPMMAETTLPRARLNPRNEQLVQPRMPPTSNHMTIFIRRAFPVRGELGGGGGPRLYVIEQSFREQIGSPIPRRSVRGAAPARGRPVTAGRRGSGRRQ